MGRRVAIVGTGQTYHKSHRPDVTSKEMIYEAVTAALADAELAIRDIDAIVIGNMDHFESINYVDAYSVEGSGAFMKPIMKVTTGGTTGTTVAIAAYYHVASGLFDRVMAIGFEKNSESDTTGAIITCSDAIWDRFSYSGAIPSLATEATAYMEKYGATQEDAALIGERDRNHALNNPYAHLQKPLTVADIMGSPMLAYPINNLVKAHYAMFNIESDQAALNELVDSFRFNDAILRHLIIKRDDAVTEQSLIMKNKDEKGDKPERGERRRRDEESSDNSSDDNSDDDNDNDNAEAA